MSKKRRHGINEQSSVYNVIKSMQIDTNNLYSHNPRDYKSLYTCLIDTYGVGMDCPAVAFKGRGEPYVLKNVYGDKLIVINRNAKSLTEELKKAIRSENKAINITIDQENMIGCNWCSEFVYGPFYKTLLEICDYLKIDVPALTISATMPLSLYNLSGAVIPGDKPYTTDVYVRATENAELFTKTLLHELRHVWQHAYHNEWYDTYLTFNKTTADEYWRQKTELDADAFAYWVMETNGINFILEDFGEIRCKTLREQMEKFEDQEILDLSIIIKS